MPIKATVSNTAPLSRQQSSKWILELKSIHRAWMNCTVYFKQSKKGENVKSCVLPPNLSRVQWISHNSVLCPCLQALRKRRQDIVEVKTWLGYACSQWQMQSDWQADMTSTQKFHTASVKRRLWSYQQGYEECKHMWTTLRCHAEWHYEILHCQHSSMLGHQPSLWVCMCVDYLKLRHSASLRVMWIPLGFRL